MKRPFSGLSAFFFLSILFYSIQSMAAVIQPKSGAAMCEALTVADFQSVGIMNATPPKTNVGEDGASAYCTYAGKSSATGGIELDVFHPAGANAKEAMATEETAIGESSSVQKSIAIPGTDDARWSPNAVSGGPTFATMTVRRGTLVFVIGIPANKNSQDQLLKLSDLVLKRL